MVEYAVVGKSVPRRDAVDKVLGQALYTDDLVLPGMLYGKILRSPYAHARILDIDTGKAERLGGVMGVVTGKDTIGRKWGVFPNSRDMELLNREKVRYVGDAVAGVAAIDEGAAEEALELIKVEYEPLPAVFTAEEAMKDDAPLLHDDKPGNIGVGIHNIHVGDVDEALKESHYVYEGHYTCSNDQNDSYCMLEPYAVLADFRGAGKYGYLDVWAPNAGPHMTARALSNLLGLKTANLRFHRVYIGGAFGGRSEVFAPAFICSLLSMKVRRPVKITLTREENFELRQAHSMTVDVKIGVKEDGTIKAIDMKNILQGGAYISTGPIASSIPYMAAEQIYKTPNLRYDAYDVYTNTPPRGMVPYHGRWLFICIEAGLDSIAERLGMDPVEIRMKNIVEKGYTTPTGSKINSCGLKEAIQKVVEKSGWDEKRGKLPYARGIGLGSGGVMSGFPMGFRGGSSSVIKFNEDGDPTVITGSVDNGQGNENTMRQIAAEVLGLPIERVHLANADTFITGIDVGAYSQAATIISGKAVMEAAEDAKSQIFHIASEMLKVKPEDLHIREGVIFATDDQEKGIVLSKVIQRAILKESVVIGRGQCMPPVDPKRDWINNPKGQIAAGFSFGATVAEVEVDIETGKVKLRDLVLAHDCGYPINPMGVEGQMHRSIFESVFKVGLFERHIRDNRGHAFNHNFLDYHFPTALDTIRPSETMIIESNDPFGPFGAKEGSLSIAMTGYSAVANAIYDAVGVRITDWPATPEKILKALEEKN